MLGDCWLGRSQRFSYSLRRDHGGAAFDIELVEAEQALWFKAINLGQGRLGAGAPNPLPLAPASGPGILRCVSGPLQLLGSGYALARVEFRGLAFPPARF